MDIQYGLSRSSVDMRLDPSPGSSVVHALQPQERLRILSRAGDMLEVESTRWQPALRGFVPASAVVHSGPSASVFPQVDLATGIRVPSVPISLPVLAFISWLQTEAESPWLPPWYREAIQRGDRPSVGKVLRQLIDARRAQWDAWVGELMADGRLDSATLDEWIVRQQGGRDMWSIRAERIFTDPSGTCLRAGLGRPRGRPALDRSRPQQRTPSASTACGMRSSLSKAIVNCAAGTRPACSMSSLRPRPHTDVAIPANRDECL